MSCLVFNAVAPTSVAVFGIIATNSTVGQAARSIALYRHESSTTDSTSLTVDPNFLTATTDLVLPGHYTMSQTRKRCFTQPRNSSVALRSCTG